MRGTVPLATGHIRIDIEGAGIMSAQQVTGSSSPEEIDETRQREIYAHIRAVLLRLKSHTEKMKKAEGLVDPSALSILSVVWHCHHFEI